MTLETQEPITTIEPILGLGENYEPETVWWFEAYDADTPDEYADEYGPVENDAACWASAREAETARRLYKETGAVQQTTLARYKAWARESGCARVALVDSDCEEIRSWPV